jgi:hypothetical protein
VSFFSPPDNFFKNELGAVSAASHLFNVLTDEGQIYGLNLLQSA